MSRAKFHYNFKRHLDRMEKQRNEALSKMTEEEKQEFYEKENLAIKKASEKARRYRKRRGMELAMMHSGKNDGLYTAIGFVALAIFIYLTSV